MFCVFPEEHETNAPLPIPSSNRLEFLSELPKRPPDRLFENKQLIHTNYFPIHFDKVQFISYVARFNPNTINSSFKRALLIAHFNKNGFNKIITDGCTVSLPTQLKQDQLLFAIRSITEVTYNVQLIPTNNTSFTIQKANVLLKSLFVEGTSNIISYKKSFYDTTKTLQYDTSDGPLKILNGFSSTIRVFGNKSYIVVNPSYKVFQTRTFLQHIENKSIDEITFSFKPISLFNKLTKKLVHIDSIDFNKTPLSTFKLKEGKDISFVDYYKTKYGAIICNVEQPLLVQKNPFYKPNNDMNEFSYFIPEFMYMTGLTRNMQTDKKLMVELSELFSKPPNIKIDFVQKLVFDYICRLSGLLTWSITIESKPIQIACYQLEKPRIIFQNKTITLSNNRDWSFEFRNTLLYEAKELKQWSALVPSSYLEDFERFEKELERYYRKIHVDYRQPTIIKLMGSKLDDCLKGIENEQIVFVVILNDSFYEEVKRKCLNIGVTTQCILPENLRKDNLIPLVSQLTFQLQSKIGGIPWNIKFNDCFDDTMVIGISISQTQEDKEAVSVVASMNSSNLCRRRRYSSVEKRGSGNEGYHSQLLVDRAIEDWYKTNGGYPKEIIIYRGSTTGNTLKQIKEGEVNTIQKIIETKNAKIKLLYLAAVSRNDLKLFNRHRDYYSNPIPGTVICDEIFESDNFEFYLIGHIPRKGMVRPVLYTCLFNSTTFTQKQIIETTFYLCHLHYSIPSSVYVPAHLLEAKQFSKLLNKCGHTKLTCIESSRCGNDTQKSRTEKIERTKRGDRHPFFDKREIRKERTVTETTSASTNSVLLQLAQELKINLPTKKIRPLQVLSEEEERAYSSSISRKRKEKRKVFSVDEVDSARKSSSCSIVNKPTDSHLSFNYGIEIEDCAEEDDTNTLSQGPLFKEKPFY